MTMPLPKKKDNSKRYFEVLLGGKPHKVYQGDRSDEEYADAIQDAQDNGLLASAESVSADDIDALEVDKKREELKAKDAEPRQAANAIDKEEEGRSKGDDFLEMQGPNNTKVKVYRGPLDDAGWAEHIEAAKKSGKLVNSVETLPAEEKPSGSGGTLQSKFGRFASSLFEGATPQNEVQKALEGASNESSDVARSKLLETRQKTASTAQSTSPRPSARMKAGLAAGVKNDSMRSTASKDFSETAKEVAPVAMQPMLPTQPPPLTTDGIDMTREAAPGTPGYRPSPALTMEQVPPSAPPPQGSSLADLPPVDPRGHLEGKVPDGKGSMLPAPPPGVSSGASVKVKAAGGPTGPQIPAMPNREGQINDAYAAADQARADQAEVQAQGFRDQARIQNEAQNAALIARADEMQQQERLQSKVAEGQAAVAKTISEMSEPAKIDPDRWWNSRSTAQQIFAVLSAGFTKGATLQMFQSAIDRDVDAQQSDISNKRSAQQGKLAGQMNIMQMAQANKLDLYESQKVAKAFAWDQIERTSKAAALNTSSASAKANATEMSAIAGIQKQKELADVDRHRQMLALDGEKLRMTDRHQRSIEGAAWTQANKKPEGPKPQPVKGAMASELSGMKDALDAAKGYSKEFKEKASKFTDKIMAWDPLGLNVTDAAKYNSKRMLIVKSMARAIEGYRVTDADMAQYEKMIPAAGSQRGEEQWNAIVQRIQQKLDNNLRGAKAVGFDLGTIDVPDEDEDSDEDVGAALGFEGF